MSNKREKRIYIQETTINVDMMEVPSHAAYSNIVETVPLLR